MKLLITLTIILVLICLGVMFDIIDPIDPNLFGPFRIGGSN